MIKIKTVKNNNASVSIKEGTPYMTILLGCEALIEELVKITKTDIDIVLGDLKLIYERDNNVQADNKN